MTLRIEYRLVVLWLATVVVLAGCTSVAHEGVVGGVVSEVDVGGVAEPPTTIAVTSATVDDTSQSASRPDLLPPLGDGAAVARWTVEIVASYPHDARAFTQGLEAAGGTMYESTGIRGRSSLRIVDPATGSVTAQVDLDDGLFGEGLTVVGDTLVQLTWQAGIAIVYDRNSLASLGEHRYSGEGWGLCLMGDELVMSDGSSELTRRDPQTFEPVATITVTASSDVGRTDYLNELECLSVEDREFVIANVWKSEHLLMIDVATGGVVAHIDASPLFADALTVASDRIGVLNGVAVASGDTFWMTGKLWPRLYEVRIVPA